MSLPSLILANERELFSRIADGDEHAFSEIFYHYTARISPFINKMTKSEQATEEIVQDVFVSIWRNRATLPSIENYQAWIFTIATNLTYNHLKSVARQVKKMHALMNQKPDNTANPILETVEFKESREFINQIIEELPPQRKLIYKLSRVEGLNHEEIAEKLHISRHTVKNQLVEALKYIKLKLQNSKGTALTLIAIWIKIYE